MQGRRKLWRYGYGTTSMVRGRQLQSLEERKVFGGQLALLVIHNRRCRRGGRLTAFVKALQIFTPLFTECRRTRFPRKIPPFDTRELELSEASETAGHPCEPSLWRTDRVCMTAGRPTGGVGTRASPCVRVYNCTCSCGGFASRAARRQKKQRRCKTDAHLAAPPRGDRLRVLHSHIARGSGSCTCRGAVCG